MNTTTHLALIAGETVTATTASGVTRTGRYLGFQPKANTYSTGATEHEGLVRWTGDDFDSITPLERLTPTEATPTVDVVGILMTTASLLRNYPRTILTTNTLLTTVMEAAGPDVTTAQLRPVFECLPHHPSGDEHSEYAALLVMTARGL